MRWLIGSITVILATGAASAVEGRSAFAGRYQIEGVGPEGSYRGSAEIRHNAGGRFEVSLRTFDREGGERRVAAAAHSSPGDPALRFTSAGVREFVLEGRLRAQLRPVGDAAGSLVASYRRGERAVRQEYWIRDETIRVPVALVVLGDAAQDGRTEAVAGPPHPAGVGIDLERARTAQTWVIAQLDAVFGSLDVAFHPIHPEPVRLTVAAVDRDGDGRISRPEAAALRDDLVRTGLKRPGRVVLVLTTAEIVGEGCRGWTLGDAPATPHTLADPNDNFSFVRLRYLDPTRYHTIAHEVGHQLGLDDIGPANRLALAEPGRRDHLMLSGGDGHHLDPRAREHLARSLARFPELGLEGARHGSPPELRAGPGDGSRRDPGLPAPALPGPPD